MKIKEVAEEFRRVACGFDADAEEFINCLHGLHRTEQQRVTRLMLRWLYSLAENPHGYDLRNQASVEAAQIVKAALDYKGWQLPYI